MPINVVLIRETYADVHQDQWALMDTASVRDPVRTIEEYGLRTTIEERHRILKCFYDLSEFCSRCFNVIAAQVVFILLSYTLRQWQLWRLHADLGNVYRGMGRREDAVKKSLYRLQARMLSLLEPDHA